MLIYAKRPFSSSCRLNGVGFVGLGLMGYPMAHNLITKSKPKTFFVYDVSKDAMMRFVKEHPTASMCSSPKDLASKAKTIISMVIASD
jgi:3-hydroxyisobutyrate dehydrogenase